MKKHIFVGYCYKCGRNVEADFCDNCQIYVEGQVITLKPGTTLEREYKDQKIKVVVTKNNQYKFNGKVYPKRGALMKAITKGKIAQFTTFFGLAEKEESNGVAPKRAKAVESVATARVEEGTIEGIIRRIVREEIKTFFRDADL